MILKPISQKLWMVMAMLCLSLSASAYDFLYDGIYYNITDAEQQTVEVTYKNTGFISYDADVIIIPLEVPCGSKTYSVTSIGESAFRDCSSLTSVTIPESVTSIGQLAFHNCSRLTRVRFSDSITSIGDDAFSFCYNLVSLPLPNSLTSIGKYAFFACRSLTLVAIPKSVTSIGDYAFSDCSAIKAVTSWAMEAPSMGEKSFDGLYNKAILRFPDKSINSYLASNWSLFENMEYIVGYDVREIGTGSDGILSYYIIPPKNDNENSVAFVKRGDYKSLTSVLIPERFTDENSNRHYITGICYNAFNGCTALIDVSFSRRSTITTIGENAFRGTSIRAIELPSTVTTIGKSAFNGCNILRSVTIPNTVTAIIDSTFYNSGLTSMTIPNSVTSIGRSAFQRCSSLLLLTIPTSVTSIGVDAFRDCRTLTSVTIPNSVSSIGKYAFYGCSNLRSVTIPNSVTSIGNGAFMECSSLTSVSIPNSVSSIGDYTFYNCTKLEKFTVEDGDVSLKFVSSALTGAPIWELYIGRDWSFTGDTSIFPNITKVTFGGKSSRVPDYAFIGCNHLYSVTIPNMVTQIGEGAFAGCRSLRKFTVEDGDSSLDFGNSALWNSPIATLYMGRYWTGSVAGTRETLTSVTLGDKVTELPIGAFMNCTKLTSVPLPSSLTSIGSYAFRGCSGLTSAVIPNSVTSIGDEAFSGCMTLKSVVTSNSLTSIGSSAFKGCGWLTSVKIPNSMTSIGSSAFSGCKALTSVTIPNSVVSINDETFNGCSGLKSVIIGKSVTSIGSNAFYNCSGLTSISIPNSVVSIDGHAFSGCTNLKALTIEDGDTPLELPKFSGVDFKKLYIGRNFTNSVSTEVEELTIGSKVTTLPEEAFKGCNLGSVVIPNSVNSIGKSAFANCKWLMLLTLSNSITTIPDSAFANCRLIGIVLPPSVATIGNSAFADNRGDSPGSSGLNKIVMGPNVKIIGENAFKGAYADDVFITAQHPPKAPVSAFSRYAKLHVQGEATVDTYYDALICWDRFDGYAMSEPQSLRIEKPSMVKGKLGEQFTLKATLTPTDVDLPYVFWRSSDPEKVYVNNDGKVTVLQDVTAEDNLEIIAETLYHNGPVAKFSFYPITTGVDEIVGDTNATMDVFTLQGVQVLSNATREQFDNLVSGIYIVRSGKDVKKVVK